MHIKIKRLDPDLPLPGYAHPGDAGLDLYSSECVTIHPGERKLISTGIAMAIPVGYAGFVQPRSGLALKKGLGIVNTPGLIDSHYRGEIKVIAVNTDRINPIEIIKGDKIAQLVIQKVTYAELIDVDELDDTERGGKGFGSSDQ
ncbi:MAG: dUTP diphosphatase [Actinobacteria bacterium]|nr:dUTP diphosphatase [Actinomycetota bacterium]